MVKLPLKKARRPTRKELIKRETWGEHFVWWERPNKVAYANLLKILENGTHEREIQGFLESHPQFLVQVLGGGHGRWVIPQKRLGAEFVTDFVLGERHSFGYEWLAVELKNPRARIFNKNGDPSSSLTHAITQIQKWRSWLKRNQEYASRPKNQNGLGLIDVDCNISALILIGRRGNTDPGTHDLRRQMASDLKIQIHSYDFLINPVGMDVLSQIEKGEFYE